MAEFAARNHDVPPPDRDHMQRVVETIYTVAGQGDWDTIETFLTDDFVLTEAEGLPYAGTYSGIRAFRDVYTHVFGFWADLSAQIVDITYGTDHAIGLLSFSGASKRTGETFNMLVAEVFVFRCDKICAVWPLYWDTKKLADVA